MQKKMRISVIFAAIVLMVSLFSATGVLNISANAVQWTSTTGAVITPGVDGTTTIDNAHKGAQAVLPAARELYFSVQLPVAVPRGEWGRLMIGTTAMTGTASAQAANAFGIYFGNLDANPIMMKVGDVWGGMIDAGTFTPNAIYRFKIRVEDGKAVMYINGNKVLTSEKAALAGMLNGTDPIHAAFIGGGTASVKYIVNMQYSDPPASTDVWRVTNKNGTGPSDGAEIELDGSAVSAKFNHGASWQNTVVTSTVELNGELNLRIKLRDIRNNLVTKGKTDSNWVNVRIAKKLDDAGFVNGDSISFGFGGGMEMNIAQGTEKFFIKSYDIDQEFFVSFKLNDAKDAVSITLDGKTVTTTNAVVLSILKNATADVTIGGGGIGPVEIDVDCMAGADGYKPLNMGEFYVGGPRGNHGAPYTGDDDYNLINLTERVAINGTDNDDVKVITFDDGITYKQGTVISRLEGKKISFTLAVTSQNANNWHDIRFVKALEGSQTLLDAPGLTFGFGGLYDKEFGPVNVSNFKTSIVTASGELLSRLGALHRYEIEVSGNTVTVSRNKEGTKDMEVIAKTEDASLANIFSGEYYMMLGGGGVDVLELEIGYVNKEDPRDFALSETPGIEDPYENVILLSGDENVNVDGTTIYLKKQMTAAQLKQILSINETGYDLYIVDENDEALEDSAIVGSGCKVLIMSGDTFVRMYYVESVNGNNGLTDPSDPQESIDPVDTGVHFPLESVSAVVILSLMVILTLRKRNSSCV